MLTGSFYQQPSATVDYWDLIRQNVWNVNNTGLKFVAFGIFNSYFYFPSNQFDILHTFQLHQLINSDTRITRSYQNPDAPNNKSIEVSPELCSDHCVPRASVINTPILIIIPKEHYSITTN